MKTLARQEIFQGRIIKVVKDDVELANGSKTTREVVFHNEAVAVAAVNENNEILMVTQHRYPIGRDMLELPAGWWMKGRPRWMRPNVSCWRKQDIRLPTGSN